MEEEYGAETVNKMQLNQNKARYIVFKPEQLDDDDVIDMIEKNPTFGRKPDFRNQLKERQQATTAHERPVEVPRAPKQASSGTIDFDE